jgi:hypothetical protein
LYDSKEYYKTHKEQWKEYTKKAYPEHREQYREYARNGYQKNKEKIKAYQKKRRQTHPEINKAYCMARYHKFRGSCCEFCNSTECLECHHPDYDFPEIIVTCCKSCHEYIHKRFD